MLKKINPFNFNYLKLTPLWIAVFVDILGFSILIPYLPYFSEKYGAPAWQIGLLLSTNALFSLFSGPVWGSLSDKYGRKPMLLLSQFGTMAGFLIMAFSGNMTMMFVSRIIDGIFGGNYPIAKAIVGDVVPGKDRSEQMSNIGVAHVLSSLVGPGISGMLSPYGIVGPGLFAAGLSLITMIVTWRFLEESNPVKLGEINLVTNAGEGKRPGASRRQIWQNPTARQSLVQWGFHTMSFMLYVSNLSLFGKLRLGLGIKEIAQLLMLSGLVRVFIRFFVFVPLRRTLGDRFTSRLGMSLFVVTFVLLGFVQRPWQFGVILCLASFAAACTRGILNSNLSRAVQPWEQGTAMGLSSALDSFAQIAGPLIGGIVLDVMPLWVYGSIAAVFALGALSMAYGRKAVAFAAAPLAE